MRSKHHACHTKSRVKSSFGAQIDVTLTLRKPIPGKLHVLKVPLPATHSHDSRRSWFSLDVTLTLRKAIPGKLHAPKAPRRLLHKVTVVLTREHLETTAPLQTPSTTIRK